MDYNDLVKPEVLTQPTYEPGKPIERVAEEFRIEAEAILKLASNENPLGVSPLAMAAVDQVISDAHLYPDGGCVLLREKIAEVRGLKAEQVIVGNGSNEVMVLLAQAFLRPGDEVVMGAQAFIVYKLATLLFEGKAVEVPMPDFKHDLDLMAEAITDKTKIVFLPSPNNPTGTRNTNEEISTFIKGLPDHVIFCFDEAYAEYLEAPPNLIPFIEQGKKVFCTRTFSKIYGLAGFRIGYGYGSRELVAYLNRIRQPFNVNGIAQAAALAAMGDTAFVEKSRMMNSNGLTQLLDGITDLGLKTYSSSANFLLLKVADSQGLFERLQREGIIIRPLNPYAMPNHVRISVGTLEQNGRLLKVLSAILSSKDKGLLISPGGGTESSL